MIVLLVISVVVSGVTGIQSDGNANPSLFGLPPLSGVLGESDADNNTVVKNIRFPPGFLFGASSSAVQVEGAWNVDGKGISGWDDYVHNHPRAVADNSTADIACDSYHLYKEDIKYIKMAGMNAYRFSLSWPRLFPTGGVHNVNKKAVDYYNDVINRVLSYNITPVVTIYHWDLPFNLTKLGGWANSIVVDQFVDYAKFVFKTFGDRVKHWITMNEPHLECMEGYASNILSPGLNMPGIGEYYCGHNKLLAHAKVYQLYKSMPDSIKAGGKIGIAFDLAVFYPRRDADPLDNVASEVAIEFTTGWFANPIFGSGDYPPVMRVQVDTLSQQEGRRESRLPRFTPEEVLLIKGSADFMGVNQYSGCLASFKDYCPDYEYGGVSTDVPIRCCPSPTWNATGASFMQVAPGSLKKGLTYLWKKYNKPDIYVTENGYPDSREENLTYNPQRESFFKGVLTDVLECIEEGNNLRGYMMWSLLDDMEWQFGYTLKFGMIHVDFSDPNRKRTLKPIAEFFKGVSENGINVTLSTKSNKPHFSSK